MWASLSMKKVQLYMGSKEIEHILFYEPRGKSVNMQKFRGKIVNFPKFELRTVLNSTLIK